MRKFLLAAMAAFALSSYAYAASQNSTNEIAAAGLLTGTTLSSNVTSSSLTNFGSGIALGTPASGVATNLTGTATALNIGGNAGTVTTINGLITNGSNITITGSGTSGSPYSIASTGGGSGTVTSVATSSPITGGTFTTSGTIACATCIASSSTWAQGDVLYYNGSNWADLPAGTSGFFLKTLGASANPVWASAAGGSLTVGTTAIASGTSTDIEFNNAGTLGEYAISGSGSVAMTASPTFTGTLAAAAITNTGQTITSTSANALTVGANGATNPVLEINSSTSSVKTGVLIKGAAAGSGVAISTISSSGNDSLSLDAKGTGTINIGNNSTGTINIGNTSAVNIVASSSLDITLRGLASIFTSLSSASPVPRLEFNSASDTGLTSSTEAPEILFNMNTTRQHATGALTLQRDFRISGSTHSFVGASTATDVAALSIDGYGQAGTNATITNAHGILIPTQAVAGTVVNAYGINVVAPTGATTINEAALFTGDTAITSGNLLVNTVGKGLIIKSGSNARIGTGTLTAGTVTIANTSVTANTRVFLQDTTSGGLTNVGVLTAVTTAGTGFVVTSTLALDTSTFNWMLVESQ